MNEEILDDLDEIEGKSIPIVFAKKAIIRARVSAMLYVLVMITPTLFTRLSPISTGKFIVFVLLFSITGLLAILAMVNAVKSIIHKEPALIKKSIALVIGIFVTYMSIISIFNYYLLLRLQ